MKYFFLLPILCIFGCSSNRNDSASRRTDSVSNVKVEKQPIVGTKSSDQVLFYMPSISTVVGVVCRKEVFSLQSENEYSEKKDRIIVVALKNKISVLNAPNFDTTAEDEERPNNEYEVDTMQLAIPSFHALDSCLDKLTELKGGLYHSDNGNHHTKVLMLVDSFRLTGKVDWIRID